MENIPTSTVRSAPVGNLVEVCGKAVASDTCHTDDGRPCAVSVYTIEHCLGYSRNGVTWYTVAEGVTPDTFMIEDDTGQIAVETRDASFQVDTDTVEELTADTASEKEAAWLQEKGVPIGERHGFWTFSPVDKAKIRENVIRPGEQVSVLGRITTEDGERVITRDTDNDVFLISDRGVTEALGKVKQTVALNTAAAVIGAVITALIYL
jgi:hypothetical protein